MSNSGENRQGQHPTGAGPVSLSRAWQRNAEEGSTHLGTPICSVASCGDGWGTVGPRSGTYWTWFGGLDETEHAFVAQRVLFCAAPATLRFWLWIGHASGTGDDVFEVTVDGTRVFRVSDLDRVDYARYTEVTVNLSAYADGGTHLLRFSGSIFGGGITNFSLDDVRLLRRRGARAHLRARPRPAQMINRCPYRVSPSMFHRARCFIEQRSPQPVLL